VVATSLGLKPAPSLNLVPVHSIHTHTHTHIANKLKFSHKILKKLCMVVWCALRSLMLLLATRRVQCKARLYTACTYVATAREARV
jgi:hypothetical protein